MAKKTAAQKKADAAFIAKIGTVGISTGGGSKKLCPDCGHEMQPIGHLEGEVSGQKLSGPVYGHPGSHGPRRRRAERPTESSGEQSFSA